MPKCEHFLSERENRKEVSGRRETEVPTSGRKESLSGSAGGFGRGGAGRGWGGYRRGAILMRSIKTKPC